MTMLAVKNFFLPERKTSVVTTTADATPRFARMPEQFLRSIRRRSLRVKRTKSLVVVPDREKRKSDSFVNSQEWTISRAVPDLRLGIVGSLNSGKSALVHRYLTGSYMQEESPEGGRFKKEIFIDNQSYLLLIRDEGGLPEMQFAAWVDAVIFVFSLENESSFNAVYNYYTKMSHFRNSAEIPIILVGTQDAISDRSPRVIDDARARKLANDLKRCSYYETCATYGLNVERVFQDACQKIVQQRLTVSTQCLTPTNSRPTTPQGSRLGMNSFHHSTATIASSGIGGVGIGSGVGSSIGGGNGSGSISGSGEIINTTTTTSGGILSSPTNGFTHPPTSGIIHPSGNFTLPHRHHVLSASSHHIPIRISADFIATEQHQQLQQQQQQLQQQQQPNSPKWGTMSYGSTSQQALQSLAAAAVDNNNIAKFTPLQHQQPQPQQQFQSTLPPSKVPSFDNLQPLGGGGGGGGGVGTGLLNPSQSTISTTSTTTTISSGSGTGGGAGSGKDLPTPTSTPTTSRKSRRRSNLFIPSSKKSDDKLKNGELGSGRSIPIKQGYLYKRSSKSLNKEWKKKYVTLCDDGRLTYHPSLHDYMDDVHGKEVSLQYVTVKVPGQKPRGSKSIITNSALTSSINFNWRSSTSNSGGSGGGGGGGSGSGVGGGCGSSNSSAGSLAAASAAPSSSSTISNGISEGISHLSLAKDKKVTEKVLLTAFDTLREPGKSNSQTSGDEGIVMSNSNSQTFLACDMGISNNATTNSTITNKLESQTPNVKKRHRRMKSSGVKNNEYDDSDAFEFYIVSLDNKQWHFEAASSEERDEWVSVIEQEIFKSLQGNESAKVKQLTSSELASMQSIRTGVPGNGFCVDCDSPNPEWASLNLGILMCIECSGIHRNLGSHISKVRSLGLDDWPPGHISVMLAIGNSLANSVWEAAIRADGSSNNINPKPTPQSTREEKEKWIRCKYEGKEFLPMVNTTITSITQQLVEAVVKTDMKSIVLLLAHGTPEQLNAPISAPRDMRSPLHLACAIGNLAITQLFIWNHGNIKQIDHDGRTCLTYAKAALMLATSQTQNYSIETTQALVELLTSLGCVDPTPITGSGTLPRRRNKLVPSFEKLPPRVI